MATSLNNLAGLYQTQGQYAEAEPLYKRALKIYEKALGPDHSEVARSLNNLASLYDTQGQYSEAEPLYKRALKIKEKAFGPDHPSVAAITENLVELHRSAARSQGAAEVLRQAQQPTEDIDMSGLFEQHEGAEGILKSFRPISLNAYKQASLEPLILWGIFNPLGPTISTLSLATESDSQTSLFLFYMLNPFQQEAWIAGVVPSDIDDTRLINYLYQLFEMEADGDSRLSPALPTFVLPLGDRLSHHAYSAFKYPAKEGQEDIGKLCEVYKAYLGKPWDRTQDQARGKVSTMKDPSSEFDEQAFIEWGMIMMNKEHVYPEIAGLKDAWDGAIGFQEQMGTLGVHKTLSRFGEVNEHLIAVGIRAFADR